MDDCTVVIVNWNARGFLEKCLKSLKDCVDRGLCRVMVVDNASSDGSPDMVREQFDWVQLIESGQNLGFAKANNMGISLVETRYVLLLNSDTEVTHEAVSALLDGIRARPDVVVVGCEHIDDAGTVRAGFGRFPSLEAEFVNMTGVFKWLPVKWLIQLRQKVRLRRNRSVSRGHSESGEQEDALTIAAVDWVSGACMMLDREPIQKIGCFDDSFFFYAEDVDLCLRASRNGGIVGYMPAVRIIHYGGGSSEGNYLALLRQFMIAKTLFYRKHHSRSSVCALRSVYYFAGLISIVKWSFAYVLPGNYRKTAREWLRFWTQFMAGRESG